MAKKLISIISVFALLLSMFAAGCASHTEEEPLVLAFVSGVDGNTSFHQENTYNAQGLLTQEYIVEYQNGAVDKTITNQYRYSSDGLLEEKSVTTCYLASGLDSCTRYFYDDQGRETAMEHNDGRRYESSYELDAEGRISKITTTAYDDEVFVYTDTEVYTYHEDGSYTVESVTGTDSYHNIFTIDAEGHPVYSWTKGPEDPATGRVLQDLEYTYEKEYHENGIWYSRKIYLDGALCQTDSRTFDENGNLIHESTYLYDTDLSDNGGAIVSVNSKFYTYLSLSDVIGK